MCFVAVGIAVSVAAGVALCGVEEM